MKKNSDKNEQTKQSLVKFQENFNLEMNDKKKWQMNPNDRFIDVFDYYIEKITYLIVKVNLDNR